MVKGFKRLLVMFLCMALVMGDSAISGFATENMNEEIKSDYIYETEDNSLDNNYYEQEKNEENKHIEEDVEIDIKEYVAEPLNETTYSLTYKLENGEATITGYEGTIVGDLIIPAEVDGYKVTVIGKEAFKNARIDGNGKALILPEGLIRIEEKAFCYCATFSGDLNIPNSVTCVEKEAFYGSCFWNGKITLGENLETIGDSAFGSVNFLKGDIIIPDKVKTIGSSAFFLCGNMKGKLVIGEGVTSIGYSAFSNFNGTELVFKGNALQEIGDYAFSEMTNVTKLVLPNSVKSIGDHAFGGCTGLKGDLVIPDSVTEMGYSAFEGCSGLDGILVVGSGLKKIEWYAFKDCSGLTGKLIIPDNIESVEYHAFENCKGFDGVEIGERVTGISSEAFKGCSGLEGSLVIPDSVNYISPSGFEDCVGLNDQIIIGKGVYQIYTKAFKGCSGFKTLLLSSGLKYIEAESFSGCSELTGTLVIPDTVNYISDYAFEGCDKLIDIYVSSYFTSFGKDVFKSSYGNIINATFHCIPGSAAETYILSKGGKVVAWDGKSDIDGSVNNPDEIDENGYHKYGEIRWLIREEVLYVAGEGSLPNLEVGKDNTPWANNKNSIIKIVFEDGITGIGDYQFKNYDSLRQIVIPSSIITIGKEVFYGNNIAQIEYEGTEENYKSSTFYSYLEEILKSQRASIVFINTGDIKGYFSYVDYKNGISTYSFEYNDSYFREPNLAYNHQLAIMSLKTEMSAFGITDKNRYPGKGTIPGQKQYENIEEMIGATGFKDAKYIYPDWDTSNPNTIGYTIANKEIIIENDEKASIILVALRGGGYGTEWGGNLNVGNQLHHAGFETAADKVAQGLIDYISDYSNKLNSKIKLWIVGYSRGGTVANLLAYKTSIGYYKGIGIDVEKEDVYAYTFETPRNTTIYRYSPNPDLIYNASDNIYNIINPVDFVPYVAMESWGFRRYGKDFFLPTMHNSNLNDYSVYREKMIRKYVEITGLSEEEVCNLTSFPYNIEFALDELADLLTELFSQQEYAKGQDRVVKDIAMIMSGGSKSKKSMLFDVFMAILDAKFDEVEATKTACTIAAYSVPILSAGVFICQFVEIGYSGYKLMEGKKELAEIIGNISYLETNHYPELCLAWMETLNKNVVTKDKPVKVCISNCPVDIFVYDSNNKLVAEIKDEKQVFIENGLSTYIDKDGQKKVALPAESDYRIEIISREDGELTYSIENYANGTDTIDNLKSYIELPLVANDIYKVVISDEDILFNPQNQVVQPDYLEEGNKINYMSVDLVSVGAGECYGGGSNYHIGEFAKVTAIPYTSEDDFLGWYIEDELVSTELEYRFPVKQDTVIEARFNDANGKMYVRGLEESYKYIGKAIIPDIQVYDGMNLLTKGVDYTVTYKNNVNVNDASDIAKAPTITVKGKGNYTQSETLTFKIEAADISGADFSSDEIAVVTTSKEQKPKPVIKWNGKVVPATGYTYQYFVADENGNPIGDALLSVKNAGDYVIVCNGQGNFTGTRNIKLTVTSTKNLASKLSVASISAKPYTGNAIMPEVIVKDGKTLLTKDKDYSVRYLNNVAVGTASVVITGTGNYIGTKTVNFKITGTAITKATVEGISPSVTYTGNDITFDDIKLYIKATKTTGQIDLDENDYTVSYQKNLNAGTATVVFTGINGYTGTLKKTFKITAFKEVDSPGRFTTTLSADSIAYSKGGAKPGVTVKFTNADGTERTLAEKTDYTVAYVNNSAVNDCSNPAKLPTAKITLKGSYSGTILKTYAITPKNISSVKVEVADKTYANKKGAYKSAVKLYDTDGKALASKKDYDATITYTLEDGTPLDSTSIVDANQNIVVTVSAKEGGNYTGTVTEKYRITTASIGTPKVTIKTQTYTGKPIELTANDITIKPGIFTPELEMGVDYKIVPNSYVNNVKKGTASVVIRGIGNYGGTRKVNFTIKQKVFKWWWR